MTATGLGWLSYSGPEGRERIVRVGENGPSILLIAPLFEEANRTRHLLVKLMRELAARGYRCFLPDLPGTLESPARLETLGWHDWDAAIHAIFDELGGAAHVVSMRGGALLDDMVPALSRWRFSPASGEALFRDLIRVRMVADREAGAVVSRAELEQSALSAPFEVAGYRFAPDFLRALSARKPSEQPPLRTVRLATEAAPADAALPGQPLWRRSEPDHDPVLLQHIIDDLSKWIEACDAS